MTIEAVVASSAPVQRQDARGPFLEILDVNGLDLNGSRGSSILDSHQQAGIDNILGVLDGVRIEGDKIIGTIRLTSRPERAATVADIREGIISNMSAGYRVETWREGTDAAGNRTRTATKWCIHEASFVSVPADRNARTRSDDRTEANRQIRHLAERAGVDPTSLIDSGATVEHARSFIMESLISRSAVPLSAHNRATLDNPAFRVAAMGEALYARATPSYRPSAAAAPFCGLTIPEMARECLQRAGVNVMGFGGVALIDRALSSSDFPLLLADTTGRTLRASYDQATSAIKRLGRETTANDFRTKHRLMLDSGGLTLEKVTELGEFRYGGMTEGEETYALDSYGKIISISRKALINDDLGAFTDLTRRMGQAAASFEADFLTALVVSNAGVGPKMSDGLNLFDAAHGNINAVTGAAPSETTLSAARLAMRRQTGLGGQLIVVEPAFVVVPPELETTTEKVLSTIRAIQVADVNVFAKLALVVEPRLTSATAWYVVADPAQCDGLEYCYLAGMPGPQTESKVGFEVDGMSVKVREDFGGGFVDHRGWYRNAGA